MSSTKDSLLQLIVQFCRNETAKPKASEGNLNHLRLALHIVSNCCCCHEGRTIINKVSETMVASVVPVSERCPLRDVRINQLTHLLYISDAYIADIK